MTADILRKAASLMRERAEAATDGGPRWETGPDEMHGPAHAIVYPADSDSAVAFAGYDDAEHIASWHPTVALVVADWLEEAADHLEAGEENDDLLPHVCPTALEGLECSVLGQSLAVARAYLGESA